VWGRGVVLWLSSEHWNRTDWPAGQHDRPALFSSLLGGPAAPAPAPARPTPLPKFITTTNSYRSTAQRSTNSYRSTAQRSAAQSSYATAAGPTGQSDAAPVGSLVAHAVRRAERARRADGPGGWAGHTLPDLTWPVTARLGSAP
jgi:hypothetical protein